MQTEQQCQAKILHLLRRAKAPLRHRDLLKLVKGDEKLVGSVVNRMACDSRSPVFKGPGGYRYDRPAMIRCLIVKALGEQPMGWKELEVYVGGCRADTSAAIKKMVESAALVRRRKGQRVVFALGAPADLHTTLEGSQAPTAGEQLSLPTKPPPKPVSLAVHQRIRRDIIRTLRAAPGGMLLEELRRKVKGRGSLIASTTKALAEEGVLRRESAPPGWSRRFFYCEPGPAREARQRAGARERKRRQRKREKQERAADNLVNRRMQASDPGAVVVRRAMAWWREESRETQSGAALKLWDSVTDFVRS